MKDLLSEFQKPVVDFDYFNFDFNNKEIAVELAILLMAYTNIDELRGIHNEDELWSSSVGTGGSGWDWPCNSQGAQRACLASHFSSYAHQHHQSCFMALTEYQCLKDLLLWLCDDYNPAPHRQKLVDRGIVLLQEVCKEFEQAYIRKEPGFLFEILKRETA